MTLAIRGSSNEPDLMFLPWHLQLEQWPDDVVVPIPRGISRHVVRFVRLNGVLYAVKETTARLADHEYKMLAQLQALDEPTVEPAVVVTGRTDEAGNELESAIVTKHLPFSLPYRALFSKSLSTETVTRLLLALTTLQVRLHLVGFAWNDCSLSNTLFRRDAGEFVAYLVDAETGDMQETLSRGQRWYDIDTAVLNVAGELMDIEAQGRLDPSIDPVELAEGVRTSYEYLWAQITDPVTVTRGERGELDERIARLREVGFQVSEVSMVAGPDSKLQVQPKVVEPDPSARRLQRLTGLDVEDRQARRLLEDLMNYRRYKGLTDASDEVPAAHKWLSECYESVLSQVPRDYRGRLESAEIYHEVMNHQAKLSAESGSEVGIVQAAMDYVEVVLANRPDELAIVGAQDDAMDSTMLMPIIVATSDLLGPDSAGGPGAKPRYKQLPK